MKNTVYSYLEGIDEIYDDRLKEFENLDDSYRKKIDSIYSEFTSGKNKFFDSLSFGWSVSWNFLKSFTKAATVVTAVALVPEVAVVLLVIGEAKYAGCAIVTYFPEDLFDSNLWHKIYNHSDKEMSELAEVSRVGLERGPLSLLGYLGQGYADKVQTPDGIASMLGGVCGTIAAVVGVTGVKSPEGQVETSDVSDVEAGGIADTEPGGISDTGTGDVGDIEAGDIDYVEAGNIGNTETADISDIEAGAVNTPINQTVNEGGGETVDVKLSKKKYPESAKHIEEAIKEGQPDTLTIDRGGASARRKASLKGVDTVPGLDRDEYPPAMSMEGGEGASVKLIKPSDNRGSGSSISGQLRKYPNGTKYRIIISDED